MPLAFQYLTSNRSRRVARTTDNWPGCGPAAGWRLLGGRPDRGGGTAHRQRAALGHRACRCGGSAIPHGYGAITQGTIGDPRLSTNTTRAQLAVASRTRRTRCSPSTSVASVPISPRRSRRRWPVLVACAVIASRPTAPMSRSRAIGGWFAARPCGTAGAAAFGVQPVRDLSAMPRWVEARYTLSGLYAAGRVDRLGFSTIRPPSASSPGCDVTRSNWRRLDGASPCAPKRLAAQPPGRRSVRASDIGVFQVVTWF